MHFHVLINIFPTFTAVPLELFLKKHAECNETSALKSFQQKETPQDFTKQAI